MTLAERAKQLEKIKGEIDKKIMNACRDATIRAIETAAENTPVGPDTKGEGLNLSGTHTRSAGMKQSWATDSKTAPRVEGNRIVTELNNNKDYASYVNDGHRMDRHFVPGLYINPDSGLLEMNPDRSQGIVVGTKTKYVPGVYMLEKGVETYRKVLEELVDDAIVEAMKK